MFPKFAYAAGFVGLTVLGSATAIAQEDANGSPANQNSGAHSGQASTIGKPEPIIAGPQPKESLASAMTNFVVRTGLVVGPDDQGRLVVQHIRPESDAARLGIKPGDVLTSVNGTPTDTMRSLQNFLTAHPRQTAFSVEMGRGSKAFKEPMGRHMSLMGMTVFPDGADRPVVYDVQPGSPAAKANVKAGDVISSVGHQTTDTMSKFMNMTLPLVRALNPGEGVPFSVARNGRMVKVSIPRPSDTDLQPLTPNEQSVLDRQGGVISPATQEVERPRQNSNDRRMPNRRKDQQKGNQNGNQAGNQNGALAAEGGVGMVPQNSNNQQGQNGLVGGGIGLGLDGGLGGGLAGTTGATGTGVGGAGSGNGSMYSVVAALYGTAQNQTANQGSSATSGTSGTNNRSRNNFTNSGVVGYVTIQSTVPLNQAANGTNGTNSTNGMNTNGTAGIGLLTGGNIGVGTTVGTGTTTGGATATAGNTIGANGAGTTGVGNSGFGSATSGVGNSGFGGVGSTGTTTANTANAANNPVLGSPGGTNPITGNTGTTPGINPQTGNTGNGTTNNGNSNYPSTVSAQITGMPQGTYSLTVTQYGNCGDAAAVTAGGPVSSNLGTIQVGTNGQGILSNRTVQYSPQAFVGRVVALVPSTAAGAGGAPINGRSPVNTSNSSANPNITFACGVFRNSNGRQPFTNGTGYNGNGYGAPYGLIGNGVNGTTGTNGTGSGTNNNSPLPGGGPVMNPLNGGAAGASGAAGAGSAQGR